MTPVEPSGPAPGAGLRPHAWPQLAAAADAELDAVYAQLEAAVAAARPRCDASGRCCRFDEWDHTLFLTAPEAARLFAEPFPPGGEVARDRCPYQVGGLCAARARRPLGCRAYFCDPAWAEPMTDAMEAALAALRSWHERHGVPWDYRPLHRWEPLAAAVAAAPAPRRRGLATLSQEPLPAPRDP
jgi:Fe-S-cluster containining protein